MRYYNEKASPYYTNIREDLIDLLPNNPDQFILEIGAGGGDTLVAIKERKLGREVVGVDMFALANSNQINPLIDQFLVLDIEKQPLPFIEENFDVIICGDVLEHLIDPWLIVEKLVYYLKKDGQLIVSIPNIRNYKVLFSIFGKGSFDYNTQGGILDKTHLRFFCRKNVIQLLSTKELTLLKIVPINYHLKYIFGRKIRLFNWLTGRLFEEFFVTQYLAVAIRTP